MGRRRRRRRYRRGSQKTLKMSLFEVFNNFLYLLVLVSVPFITCCWNLTNEALAGSSSSSKKTKLRCPSLFMFMFRSRRNALLKQLWRRAAVRLTPSPLRDASEDPGLLSSSGSSSGADEDTAMAPDRHGSSSSWIKSAAHALFKRLTDDQLSLLLDAVEGAAQGADTSGCLIVDNSSTSYHIFKYFFFFFFVFFLYSRIVYNQGQLLSLPSFCHLMTFWCLFFCRSKRV